MRFFIVNEDRKVLINLKNVHIVVYLGKYIKMNTKQKRKIFRLNIDATTDKITFII